MFLTSFTLTTSWRVNALSFSWIALYEMLIYSAGESSWDSIANTVFLAASTALRISLRSNLSCQKVFNSSVVRDKFLPDRELLCAWSRPLAACSPSAPGACSSAASISFVRHRKKILKISSEFVFCHLNGKPLKSFSSAWKKILELAGIENFHFHDLRHTFCSNLILSGASLKDVKEMIGHSDISMTDRYSHLTLKHLLSQQQNLAKHYSNEGYTS